MTSTKKLYGGLKNNSIKQKTKTANRNKKKKGPKTNIQHAGYLSTNNRTTYYNLIKNLYGLKYNNNDEEYSNILIELFNILSEHTTTVLKDKKDLNSNTKQEIEHLEKDLINIIEGFNNHLKQNQILSLDNYNVFCLQIVILLNKLTELKFPTERTDMTHYFQQPMYKINEEYAEFSEDYTNQTTLYEKVKESKGFISILGSINFDIRKMKRVLDKPYSFEEIKKSCILCYLGIMSLEELVLSFINEIYLIGITDDLDWADGKELTPFEFVHHDLTHANNRGGQVGYNIINEKKFFEYYEKLPNSTEEEKTVKYQCLLMLFLLIHEHPLYEFLLKKKISKTYTHFYNLNDSNHFVFKLGNWLNFNYFAELLPESLREEIRELNLTNPEQIELYINEEAELLKYINSSHNDKKLVETIIKVNNYLLKSWNVFVEHWNSSF
jgi:hypothetical protein